MVERDIDDGHGPLRGAGRPVRISLSQGKAGEEFSPLAPHRELAVSLAGIPVELLDHLRLSMALDLRPGEYSLSLFEDEQLPASVADECTCHLTLTAGRPEGAAADERMVTSVELAFSRPLVLGNLLAVLMRLQSRFADNDLTALMGKVATILSDSTGISDLKTMGRLVAGAARERLRQFLPGSSPHAELLAQLRAGATSSAAQAARVRLERVSARPVRRHGAWQLELRFTGQWDFAGRFTLPFNQVRIHRAILPAPHALLDNLLTSQPLATARLRPGNAPALLLAQQLGTMVSQLRGTLAARGTLPDLAIEAVMADQGHLQLDCRELGAVELRAALSGTVERERLELAVTPLTLLADGRRLTVSGAFSGWTLTAPGTGVEESAIGRCLESLYSGEWSSQKLAFRLRAGFDGGSRLPPFAVSLRYEHPLLKGTTDLQAMLSDPGLGGELGLVFGHLPAGERSSRIDLEFAAGFELLPGSELTGATASLLLDRSTGKVAGRVTGDPGSELVADLRGEARLAAGGEGRIAPFPEFQIEEGRLKAAGQCEVSFDGRITVRRQGVGPTEADFAGSRAQLALSQLQLELDGHTLTLPGGSRLEALLEEGVLATSGLGRARLALHWDLLGHSPLLTAAGPPVEIFVPALLQGGLTVQVTPAGGIKIGGPAAGLYDAHFFNALINPLDEPGKVLEILKDAEALERIFAALRLFSPAGVSWLERIRTFVRRVEAILREEGIDEPSDLIPAPVISRLLARIIFDRAELTDRFAPIVAQVVGGEGLNLPAIKRLLADELPPHDFEFEVDRLLRLAARLLAPADPPPPRPLSTRTPLGEDERYRQRFAALPTAADLYRQLDEPGGLSPALGELLGLVAPMLTLEQLAWVNRKVEGRTGIPAPVSTRLNHVTELKRRVRAISEGYGGVAFAPQAMAISFFLAETIRRCRHDGHRDSGAPAATAALSWLVEPGCLLGPADVAVLLQAGLASVWAGRMVQLNQRLLLDLVLEQPPGYLRAVLVELGRNDPRVLTAALNSLLSLPQTEMRHPLDLVGLLSTRLGFEIPRLEDFLAGGRRANHSYYEALSVAADQVLSQAEPYRALLFRLQEARRPAVGQPRPRGPRRELLVSARRVIAAADKAGRDSLRRPGEGKLRRPAARAYEEAFNCCAELLVEVPGAFQLPAIREFWQRNHEALVVRSVVTNVQEDVDQVRRWLEVRSQAPIPADEQQLVDRVIEQLYWFPEDRRRIASDPLVRLLLPPPPGPCEFTLVSCMGVITGGSRGSELTATYERLRERLGVTVIRADTGTGRDLDYNARRIIEAIEQVQTPWGYVGYSQGCANGLKAESMLMGGTPEQQRLLDRLVCRNLLFSAFNASTHGTCGDQKFLSSMVYLDHFLAHYQARFSARAIQAALRLLRLGLDSRTIIMGLSGSRSLSTWGVLSLHQGGQFKDELPTSSVRGVVERETLPEALEWLANVLTRQAGTTLHDTQVTIEEARGRSLLVANGQMEALARCDLESAVQRTHHWSPLREDTEFITTDRDRRLAIYDYPKDRHIFPWIEVNRRFGRIKSRAPRES